MKRKYTEARKARRLNLAYDGAHTMPVWKRRLMDIYGADCKEFDAKHPYIADFVEGIKQRIAKEKAAQQRAGKKLLYGV